MPHVPDSSLVAQLAVNYGFTQLVTRLGMSYLQRLAAQVPTTGSPAAAVQCPSQPCCLRCSGAAALPRAQ